MERWQHAFAQSDDEFKRLFGVKKEVFLQMLDVLSDAREKRRRKGGRRPKLSVADQLFLTLQYWREYRTMEHIAYDFGVAPSTVSDTIMPVENVLIQDGTFHLPGKKALLSKETTGRTLAVDVTESPIERPKKTKTMVFGQEKATHDKNPSRHRHRDARDHLYGSREGSRSRFPVVQETIRGMAWAMLLLAADSGYQGLLGLHKNSRIPYKSSKNHPLTPEQKSFNRELSSERIVIENVNAKIKTFKIMSERYRNRRKRHLLRMNLVCAVLNHELRL